MNIGMVELLGAFEEGLGWMEVRGAKVMPRTAV